MGVRSVDDPQPVLQDADLIVDALYGTGLTRAVDDVAAKWIEEVNHAPARAVAVDLPSGLDADQGNPLGPTIRAASTVTFLGPKPGFFASGAAAYTGAWTVDDIGMPEAIRRRHGVAYTAPAPTSRGRGAQDDSPAS